jgi:GNAT superfamily N-acetyltransferase
VLAVDGTEIRGIGEFVSEQVDRADLALVVEDAFQGCGIGRSLFRTLEQLAREHGIRAFTGDMAYGNARAAALLRGTGRGLRLQVGYGSLHFTLRLAP